MKKNNILFLAGFGLLLVFPLVFADKVGGKVSEDENRYLASFPDLSIHAGIQNEFENWMNDNAGGRTQLKKLYNQVNIELLKSPRDAANFYNEDWVFTLNDSILQFLQHTDVMDEQQQKVFIDDYRKIQEALSEQDISMSTMVYPHKSEMYSEKFENYVLPVSTESQLDVLERIASQNEEMNIDVTYQEFLEQKSGGKLLYSRAYDGSHWNNQGAFEGYKMLMESVARELPEFRWLTEDEFVVENVQREKTYNGRLYSEEDLEYAIKEPKAELDMAWFESIQYESSDMWNSYRYYKNSNSNLPKIVIVGDSYTWMFMLPWISESFSETVFIHQLDCRNLQYIIDIVKPDMVVFAGLHNTVEEIVTQVSEGEVLKSK